MRTVLCMSPHPSYRGSGEEEKGQEPFPPPAAWPATKVATTSQSNQLDKPLGGLSRLRRISLGLGLRARAAEQGARINQQCRERPG